MNRRLFLSSLLGAAATLDPERLLWAPGRKLISIPPLKEKPWCIITNLHHTHDGVWVTKIMGRK